jgi:hypothetical protein
VGFLDTAIVKLTESLRGRGEDVDNPSWVARPRSLSVDGDKPVYLYLPWIAEHGDALIAKIARAGHVRFEPLDLYAEPGDAVVRARITRYAAEHPQRWRRIILRRLVPYASRVAGLVVTFDWHPVMRELVQAARSIGLPVILVPHESVFMDERKYYLDASGADLPAADRALLWGSLQRRIFLERGYPADRVEVTGSPKFDALHDLKPSLDRAGFAALYGLSADLPILLFAAQPLDLQLDRQEAALARQRDAIRDLLDSADGLGCQALIRLPPARRDVIGAELRARIEASERYALDGPVRFMVQPEEALYHADLVVSLNSTMLFEAALVGRAALTARYLDLPSFWAPLGIPDCKDRRGMAAAVARALAGPASRAALDFAWAADALAPGKFDGGAGERVAQRLAAFAAMPRAEVRRAERPAEILARSARRTGGAALVSARLDAAEAALLGAALGTARLTAAEEDVTGAGTDYAVSFASRHRGVDARYTRLRRALGRPQLFADPAPLPPLADGRPATLVLDDVAPYFDAHTETRLVQWLNGAVELAPDEAIRASALREAIVAAGPFAGGSLAADAGRRDGGPRRILVIDQPLSDRSVALAGATDATFAAMLAEAAASADEVLVWREPGERRGTGTFLADLRPGLDRTSALAARQVRVLGGEAELRDLAPTLAAVACVTADRGFEAALAGLPVVCHAPSWFAGWGVTTDRVTVPFRRRTRTIEALLHAIAVRHARSVDPVTGAPCPIERVIPQMPAPAARGVGARVQGLPQRALGFF